MHVFCDFDGTISIKDTTDEMLTRFAAPEWEIIEDSWKRGEMGSAECMRRQIALLGCSKQQLDDALDSVAIDLSFVEFVHYCKSIGAPLTVISDGVDYFIHRILKRYHLDHLPVIANRLAILPEHGYMLSSPYSSKTCTSGVCKCRQLNLHAGTRIFVGDGRSDFCATEKADVIFAKCKLAEYCENEAIAFTPYQTFIDVEQEMKRLLPGIIHKPATGEHFAFA